MSTVPCGIQDTGEVLLPICLTDFPLSSLMVPKPCGEQYDIDVTSRAKDFTLACSLYIDQSRASVLTTAHRNKDACAVGADSCMGMKASVEKTACWPFTRQQALTQAVFAVLGKSFIL